MKIFLDANILFSAAQSQSRMRAFITLLSKHAVCITSPYAAEEARRNLENKYPNTLPSLETLLKKCEIILAMATTVPITLPTKDLPILRGATAGNATYLLTGDQKDFGKFWGKTIHGVKIVSPKLLAEKLAKRGWL